MIAATRGLVVGTVLLAVATAGLVDYTRALVQVEQAAQATEAHREAPAPAR